MPWVGFPTRAAFDQVHDAFCTANGIPRPGYLNAGNGQPALNNQWTNCQFAPLVIDVLVNGNPRKIGIAEVSQQLIDQYGLTEVVIVSRSPIGVTPPTWNVTYNGNPFTVTPVENEGLFPFRKAKPPTWTDPKTGIVYNTTTGQPVP